MSANDGGPAFPTDSAEQLGQFRWHTTGMTLRDYFAAKAMQGLMNPGYYEIDTVNGVAAIAANAYTLADAMLAERAK